MTAKCQVLISPVRKENSEQSEMISQMLYGETCTVEKTLNGFSKIKMDFDGTEGWTSSLHLKENQNIETSFLLEKPFGIFDLEEGRSLLSIGSELGFPTEKAVDLEDIRTSISNTAKGFLNVPFLWGGRSFFGVDDAGFVQLVYKVHGISLPRNSDKQSELGEVVDFLGESDAGDLAFFEDSEGKISHVGLMLNSYEVIHAFGKVRIDSLDTSGIYNKDLGKHTHKLRFVKKIL